MTVYAIRFRSGAEIREEGARAEYAHPRVTIFDAEDREIITYQDGDIVSCEPVAD